LGRDIESGLTPKSPSELRLKTIASIRKNHPLFIVVLRIWLATIAITIRHRHPEVNPEAVRATGTDERTPIKKPR
jgi:hypothetical protein